MRDRERTDGVRMGLLVFVIRMGFRILRSLSGMRRSMVPIDVVDGVVFWLGGLLTDWLCVAPFSRRGCSD